MDIKDRFFKNKQKHFCKLQNVFEGKENQVIKCFSETIIVKSFEQTKQNDVYEGETLCFALNLFLTGYLINAFDG